MTKPWIACETSLVITALRGINLICCCLYSWVWRYRCFDCYWKLPPTGRRWWVHKDAISFRKDDGTEPLNILCLSPYLLAGSFFPPSYTVLFFSWKSCKPSSCVCFWCRFKHPLLLPTGIHCPAPITMVRLIPSSLSGAPVLGGALNLNVTFKQSKVGATQYSR